MAAVRKSGHKGLKASQRETEREEQPPAKGNKRTQSIAGMFEGVRSTRRKLDEENYASIAQATRVGHAGDDFFTRFTTKKHQAENHPVYLAFRGKLQYNKPKFLVRSDHLHRCLTTVRREGARQRCNRSRACVRRTGQPNQQIRHRRQTHRSPRASK